MVPDNQTPRILVIGDLMIDHYLWGSCERISPEAPVPVVNIERRSSVLGGAGNVINNLRVLGADVDVMGVIGTCSVAEELKKLLTDIKVSTEYLVVRPGRMTPKKNRLIAAHQQIVRYDQENTDDIEPEAARSISNSLAEVIDAYDIILLSDYGKGVLTDKLTEDIIQLAGKHYKKVLVDPQGNNYSKYSGAYLLAPNKKEASLITGININDQTTLAQAIAQLKKDYRLTVSLITLSEDGIAVDDGKLSVYPTVAKEVFDVTGAGDTVLAALGYALACGQDIHQAVRFANLAAGVVIGKVGSATTDLNEINRYQSALDISVADQKIKTQSQISVIAQSLRTQGKKITFTNGCFDILHRGHVSYLENAKKFGDVLILGLNSDPSVQQLKGTGRPVNNQEDRAYVLAGLECVDFVVIFDEQTPYKLIKSIHPDILVKGNDYDGQEVVGQDLVAELKLVQFIEGKSTTEIIEKIRQT